MGIMTLMFVADLSAQGSLDIKGHKKYDLAGFTRIVNTTSARIFITRSNTFTVEAEGSDAFLEALIIRQSGNELQIRTRPWKSFSRQAGIVHISLPELEELKLTGSGDAEMQDPFYSDRFKLEQTGSGESELILECDDMEVRLTGSGNALIQGTIGKLDLKQTGSGDCEVIGFIDTLSTTLTGSGDLDGTMLKAGTADFLITGSGSAELTVEEELSAKLTGSGDLRFSGDPRLGTIIAVGSGKMTNLE